MKCALLLRKKAKDLSGIAVRWMKAGLLNIIFKAIRNINNGYSKYISGRRNCKSMI